MQNRVYWLDAARAIAILLVVFTHCHEQAGIWDPFRSGIFYTIDRLGVPIFFMISGGLILDRIKDVDVFKFYRKRVVQFFVLLVVYSVLTNVVKISLETGDVWGSIIKSLIDYNGVINTEEKLGIYGGARQLWFMYSIIQLYLVAPFIAKLLTDSSTKNIIIFTVLCMVFNQVRVTLNTFGYGWDFLNRLGQDFTGSYLFYFLVGYLIISRDVLKGYNKILLCAISIMLVVIPSYILVSADVQAGKLIGAMHWYNGSIFILLSSVGLLILIKLLFENTRVRFLEALSLCSFGIYLSHYAFIYVFKFVQSNYMPAMIDIEKAGFYFMASLITSFGLAIVMMRVKVLRYFVR